MSEQATTFLRQARGFLRVGDSPRAVELLEKARVLSRANLPLHQTVLEELSGAYAAVGQHDRAARCRDQAAAMAPAAPAAPVQATDFGTQAVNYATAAAPRYTAPRKKPQTLIMSLAAAIVILLGAVGLWFWKSSGHTATGPAAPSSDSTLARTPSAVRPITAPNAGAAPPSGGWAAIFERTEPSVYQIQAYTKRSGEERRIVIGTAWSVRPGELATNAHVADAVSEVGPAARVIARRGGLQFDLRIVHSRSHPGYQESLQLFGDYRPYIPEESRFLEFRQPCDVALLDVHPDDVVKQAPRLPLAPGNPVAVGDEVAYKGFPAEHVSSNFEKPASYNGIGNINRFLGFLSEDAVPGTDFFIQHSLATVGGASGSPILNNKGQVVAVNFAGDYQGKATNGSRLPVAGFKYAVPIRMVQEMLDNEAETRQKDRSAGWEATLRQQFQQGIAKPKRLTDYLARIETAALTTERSTDQQTKPIAIDGGTVLLSGSARNRQVDIHGPGIYVLCVCSNQPGDGMQADLIVGSKTFGVNQLDMSDPQSRRMYYGSLLLPLQKLTGSASLQLNINAAKQCTVEWTLYRVVSN